MRFRIYPTKSNTIASGFYEDFNSSYNPTTNLWYGGTGTRNSITRHLVYFDTSELSRKLTSKDINESYVTEYRLKFENVVPTGKILESDFEFSRMSKKIASSYDLIAFPINKSWDQGRGYDLEDLQYIKVSEGEVNLTGFSNWNYATSTTAWDEPGVFSDPTGSTAVTIYSTQHFDRGDEDLDMDITNMVKDWLSGGTVNNGIAIGFARTHELVTGDTRFITSFFTEKTNTAFKPYIEVIYDNQVIREDRTKMSTDRSSRLFLHLFSGNSNVNYFSAGTVAIQTVAGANVASGLTPTLLQKGSYYVDITMSGATKGQKYKDVWNNVTFDAGVDSQTFSQTFQIGGSYYNNLPRDINDYVVDLYGISSNEILKKGEIKRLYAETRMEYSTKSPSSHFGLDFRIMLNKTTEIIPWSEMHTMVIDNNLKCFFDLDTSWLLENQNYEIQLRINDLGTKRILPEKISFSIENQ